MIPIVIIPGVTVTGPLDDENARAALGPFYDRMIARTQDGPDPLVPEPGPGSIS
jgi:hypothetical protein